MIRILFALLLVAAVTANAFAARYDLVGGIGHSYGFSGAYPLAGGMGSGTPAPTGDILLVDGTSLILQTDGASFICLAGGC